MGIPNLILFFPSNDSMDHKSPISCLWTDFNIFFFFNLEIWWRFQSWYCTLPQMTLWITKVQFLVYGPIWIFFFSLTWKFNWDSKSNIVLSLKWLTEPQKSNFLFMDRLEFFFLWLGNSMGILNSILIFTSNHSLDHNYPISCLWTDLNIFLSLTWKFDGDSKSVILKFNSNDSLSPKVCNNDSL